VPDRFAVPDRFEPPADSRPDDRPWPEATWPPAADTVLAGDWVELRPTAAADAPALFAALDDDRVWTHLAARPASPADVAARLDVGRAAGWFPWTLRLARPVGGLAPGAVVGWSSYLEVSAPDARCEIGSTAYAPAAWAGPVNPEAKLLLLGHAFDALGMGRVQLKTDVRNVRSQRAIARLGARYEGVLRRYQRRADGTVRDSVQFSITAEEWPAVRAGLVDRLREWRGRG
jgi:RimJ/RimL family protein N-acetyltransferase